MITWSIGDVGVDVDVAMSILYILNDDDDDVNILNFDV